MKPLKGRNYANLAAEANEHGWTMKVYPVEVGCMGFIGNSTIRVLKEVGIRDQVQRMVVRELATVADTVWAAKMTL